MDRTELRKKVPHGGCKKIASIAKISANTVAEFFKGRSNNRSVALAVIEVLTEVIKNDENINDRLHEATGNNQLNIF